MFQPNGKGALVGFALFWILAIFFGFVIAFFITLPVGVVLSLTWEKMQEFLHPETRGRKPLPPLPGREKSDD